MIFEMLLVGLCIVCKMDKWNQRADNCKMGAVRGVASVRCTDLTSPPNFPAFPCCLQCTCRRSLTVQSNLISMAIEESKYHSS